MTNQTNAVVAMDVLRNTSVYLYNQSTSGYFAVSIGGAVYDIDNEQTTVAGLPVCPPGAVRVATMDARCGKVVFLSLTVTAQKRL